MSLAVVAAVYPVIFISELPDKTMFASLVLATRGRALAVWAGAASAFAVHVCIAVTIGAALFTWLPQRAVQALAAALFFGAGAWLLIGSIARPAAGGHTSSGAAADDATDSSGTPSASPAAAGSVGWRRIFLTTFGVVFLAEWGDLTQILTASLAARFHQPVAVGLGAALALWSVAALAVVAGRPLQRLPSSLVRRLTGTVLLALAAFAAVAAASGG
ncbi:MAG TPA: TMEM165/GDT1 family protein [Streptosporangiaceae bacterium]|nr:TMEM165/GDT1 family protein [Streptosporangiaceae bacterium]